MITAVVLLAAAFQLSSVPPADSQVTSIQQAMQIAEKEEQTGSPFKAVELYDEARKQAVTALATDPANAARYKELIARAALHSAVLLEPQGPLNDLATVQKSIDYYQIARDEGTPSQSALARNNRAALLWGSHRTDAALAEMKEIDYQHLTPDERSLYLVNYGQLLELSSVAANWANAGIQYQTALQNTPTDEGALAGIRRLLGRKLPDRVSLAIDTSDLLMQKRHARVAADLLFDLLNGSAELSTDECNRLMVSLLRAYAVGTITADEFEKSDWPRLDALKTTHPGLAPTLLELRRAFLLKFEVGTVAAAECRESEAPDLKDTRNVQQQVGVPLVPGIDHALSQKFQSTQGKSVERLFPQYIALGAAPSLSQLLKFVADGSAQESDFACAAHKYAAAWLLDTTNTAAALQLAVMYSDGRLPDSLQHLVNHDIAEFYSPTHPILSALYQDPSQHPPVAANAKGQFDRSTIYTLTRGKESTSGAVPNVVPARPQPSQVELTLVPRQDDRFVSGVAPANTESVYVETHHGRLQCAPALPLQSAVVATDRVTGSFTVQLEKSLAKGDTVCVYPIQSGVRSANPLIGRVLGVQFLDHMHNYVAAGGFLSQVGGGWELRPRASWNTDLNVARWGYRRYQDQSSQAYPWLTALINLYAEARTAFIPKATTAQPDGTGMTRTASLEFGGYAPLFAHGSTWRFWNYQRAAFMAPLIKGGVDFFPDLGAESSVAGGVRLGILRLARSTRFNAPDLQSYVDVVCGNNTSPVTDPHVNSTVRPRQVNVTGMLKIPETPFYLGFNSTAGPGAKQNGVFAGARVEFNSLFPRGPRFGAVSAANGNR